jgi:hypothetical protein
MQSPQKDKREGRMIHVRLSEATHKLLRIRTAELDTTIQDWVAALIERELGQKNKGTKP